MTDLDQRFLQVGLREHERDMAQDIGADGIDEDPEQIACGDDVVFVAKLAQHLATDPFFAETAFSSSIL